MKVKCRRWICIAGLIGFVIYTMMNPPAEASIFGEETAVLVQILAKTIQQIQELQQIIGATRQTVSVLEEMNRGVKEVLRLAETAHLPLPKQVYDQAKDIDQSVEAAKRIYGIISENAPEDQKTHYRSGVEGLYISQDAFEYSTFLDKTGERVKSSAIVANQASATRLTAETLGVLLHAVSHSNRIQAKSLEILSTDRLERSRQDNARYSSFIETHDVLIQDLNSAGTTPLNSFGGTVSAGSQNPGGQP